MQAQVLPDAVENGDDGGPPAPATSTVTGLVPPVDAADTFALRWVSSTRVTDENVTAESPDETWNGSAPCAKPVPVMVTG